MSASNGKKKHGVQGLPFRCGRERENRSSITLKLWIVKHGRRWKKERDRRFKYTLELENIKGEKRVKMQVQEGRMLDEGSY